MEQTAIDPSIRAKVHKRTMGVLFVGSLTSRGAGSVIFPVMTLAIKELLDSAALAGIGTAATTVGAAGSAAALAALMNKRGRNPGLTVGFVTAIVGGLIAALGFENDSLFVFLAGLVLVGVGRGTSNLMRYVAADLATEERRSRDISWIVFAATFGAVGGPLLLGWSASIAEAAGLNELTGGMLFGVALFAIAGAVVWVFMRPDPLRVAGQLDSDASPDQAPRSSFMVALKHAWVIRNARLALVAMAVGQSVMVMVMTMTPIHMSAHGHEVSAVGFVIAAHTAGMFAFSPFAGKFSDRFGRVPTIIIGSAILALSTVFTVFAGEAPALLMYPGLYLLGLGWSFAIVGGSALLTESVAVEDRVSVQGAADMTMNLASGTAAIAAGLVFEMTGFHILSMLALAGAAVMFVHGYTIQRLAPTESERV